MATGMAWTPNGGDILFIESTRMNGQKGLTLTGSLGDVMKESAQAALSYIRIARRTSGYCAGLLRQDRYPHPRARRSRYPRTALGGVTIAASLASLLTGRSVRPDVAMTGEITLRGKVLPVGGIKEKVLAARRAGIRTVILPRRNESDLEDIAPELRQELEFVFVDTVDEVLSHALRDGAIAPAAEHGGEAPASERTVLN